MGGFLSRYQYDYGGDADEDKSKSPSSSVFAYVRRLGSLPLCYTDVYGCRGLEKCLETHVTPDPNHAIGGFLHRARFIVAWGRRGIHVEPAINRVTGNLAVPTYVRFVRLEHTAPAELATRIADLIDDILCTVYSDQQIEEIAPKRERSKGDPSKVVQAWSQLLLGMNPNMFGCTTVEAEATHTRICKTLKRIQKRNKARYGGGHKKRITFSGGGDSLGSASADDDSLASFAVPPLASERNSVTLYYVSGGQRLGPDHWQMLDILGYLLPPGTNQWIVMHMNGDTYDAAMPLAMGGWNRRWTQVYLDPPSARDVIRMSTDILQMYRKSLTEKFANQKPSWDGLRILSDDELHASIAQWCHEHTHDEIESYWCSVLRPLMLQDSWDPAMYSVTYSTAKAQTTDIPGRVRSITRTNPRDEDRDARIIERAKEPAQFLGGNYHRATAIPNPAISATATTPPSSSSSFAEFAQPNPISSSFTGGDGKMVATTNTTTAPDSVVRTPGVRTSKRLRFHSTTTGSASKTRKSSEPESEDTTVDDATKQPAGAFGDSNDV